MKLLIAVITCRKFTARANIQRETWMLEAQALGIDVRFFIGGGQVENDWEVVLDVPDDYPSVRRKVQLAMQWAVDNNYDHILKTDDDCAVFPSNWMHSGFDCYPYVGRKRGPSGNYPCDYDGKNLPNGFQIYGYNETDFCSGFGYTLSNAAARVVAAAKDNGDWAEDRFSGNALAKQGVKSTNSVMYVLWPLVYGCGACHSVQQWRGQYTCQMCKVIRSRVVVACPYDKPGAVEFIYREHQKTGLLPVRP